MNWWRWLREAISDEAGQADIAYIAIFALTCGALGSLFFISAMSAVAYFRCVPLVKPDVVVNCAFDPLPMGQAAGLIFGAFGALIGSLAGYMVATRKQRPVVPAAAVTATTTTTTTAAIPPTEATTEYTGPATIAPAKKGKR